MNAVSCVSAGAADAVELADAVGLALALADGCALASLVCDSFALLLEHPAIMLMQRMMPANALTALLCRFILLPLELDLAFSLWHSPKSMDMIGF
ncbi:hypothetical protein [Cohnella rhizosphaerae]|uniref:Uncharacterized protein n=1 Tax=Cohnella rhizosphaerae TaxID=1457232 RepID=A0A9X4L0N6_9BACL|nr:hypothetical protein [Cohnella rhizosphaerae]MDG0811357.1 hypothetical protein [Cohnella rhizosphaerae]